MTRRLHITVASLSAIVATLWIATGSVFAQEPSSSPPQAETSTESWNFPKTALAGHSRDPRPGLPHVRLRPAATDRPS